MRFLPPFLAARFFAGFRATFFLAAFLLAGFFATFRLAAFFLAGFFATFFLAAFFATFFFATFFLAGFFAAIGLAGIAGSDIGDHAGVATGSGALGVGAGSIQPAPDQPMSISLSSAIVPSSG